MNASSGNGPPLPGYDRLTAGEIEHRARSLPADELDRLLAYERAHADRAPVVQVLTARRDQLASGAEPSPGGRDPEAPHSRRAGSPVGPETAGEPVHPPPHGTPRQPAKPKGDARP
jgi:hypothetical protein